MATRAHQHAEELPHSPEAVFAILHTPSAIRGWWSAARAIVLAQPGGLWSAAWGEDEDNPDYITIAKLAVFDPPKRIVFSDYRYFAKSGPLPFQADFTTEFAIEPRPGGCLLRVTQDGFPCDASADGYYAACEVGWKNTFSGIRAYLAKL